MMSKTKRIYSYLTEEEYKEFNKVCEESMSVEIRKLIRKEIKRWQKRKKK
jgi:hypothetical protein